MEVIIKKTYEEVSKEAGKIFKAALKKKPDLVLGLATGTTPLGLYKEMIRMHKEEKLDFSKVRTFNLDEYLGLAGDHVQSYRYFMDVNLFNHINIDKKNTHVPDGKAKDPVRFCEKYEQAIKDVGGVDVQVLGIGRDGHIGFNEPGSSLGSRTRVKTLTKETIEDNGRLFKNESEVPHYAITMGVGTVMDAKMCLLLANGWKKARPMADMIEGGVSQQCTASVLQLHRDVVVIIDEEAAWELRRKEYYKWVAENKDKLPV
jgi:glucosamine-6-phosphate deaminase